jgi:hypothetical protein
VSPTEEGRSGCAIHVSGLARTLLIVVTTDGTGVAIRAAVTAGGDYLVDCATRTTIPVSSTFVVTKTVRASRARRA